MSANIQDPYGAWLILGCIVFVLLVACGSTVCHKLGELNRKHHLIEWGNESIYAWDDDEN